MKLYYLKDGEKAWNDKGSFDIQITANDEYEKVYHIETNSSSDPAT